MPEPGTVEMTDEELIQHIFFGKLDNLPSLASKIVRIFTSSTFTGRRSRSLTIFWDTRLDLSLQTRVWSVTR